MEQSQHNLEIQIKDTMEAKFSDQSAKSLAEMVEMWDTMLVMMGMLSVEMVAAQLVLLNLVGNAEVEQHTQQIHVLKSVEMDIIRENFLVMMVI